MSKKHQRFLDIQISFDNTLINKAREWEREMQRLIEFNYDFDRLNKFYEDTKA